MSPDPTRRELLRESGLLLGAGAAAPLLVRPRIARAARRPPRSLRSAVRGQVFSPGEPGYLGAARVFNPRFDGVRPAAVVRPVDTRDVRDAMRVGGGATACRSARGPAVTATPGTGRGDGALVLDLRRLNGMSLDRGTQVATVGAGAQLIDVYRGLGRAGAVPAGRLVPVGRDRRGHPRRRHRPRRRGRSG